MPVGLFLDKENSRSIFDFSNAAIDGGENCLARKLARKLNQCKTVPEFFRVLLPILSGYGADITKFNRSLVLYATEYLMDDVDPKYIRQEDIFFIANRFHQWDNADASSPYYDDNSLEIFGDLFNNIPLTTEGKMYVDKLHDDFINCFREMMINVCISKYMESESI